MRPWKRIIYHRRARAPRRRRGAAARAAAASRRRLASPPPPPPRLASSPRIHKTLRRIIQHSDKILYKTCFGHNSTHKAPTEELLVRILTNFCVDSESAIKTLSYFKNLHATSDLQVPSNRKGLTQTLNYR